VSKFLLTIDLLRDWGARQAGKPCVFLWWGPHSSRTASGHLGHLGGSPKIQTTVVRSVVVGLLGCK